MSTAASDPKSHGEVPVLQVEDLKKYFPLKAGWPWTPKAAVRAVDGVSFSIRPNEIFGLAGESGCGKSTVGRLVLALIRASAGRIFFEGREIAHLPASQLRALRPRIQMVFQDPYTSLNPRRTVADIVSDPLVVHTRLKARERRERVLDLLGRVGLARDHYFRYPHEFSGGQRQRIAIARALILNPAFLTLDEPTSALDVSVQAVIINLIQKLQSDLHLSCLFITHDLNLLRFLCNRVAIMYLGRIVELAGAAEVFAEPLHPYSRALMAATPRAAPGARRERFYLEGEVPSNVTPPPGCTFNTRCPEKIGPRCETEAPDLQNVEGRLVRCHLYG